MNNNEDLNTYRTVVGCEIHVQLKTKTKMFSPAANNPDEKEPNTNIDEIVTGQPGSLPVLNEEAVRLGVALGLALNCEIPEYSKFDRKHYFYPDLPKGYQISQLDEPIAKNGWVEIEVEGKKKRIGITRAHLEEDAGKNVHPEGLPYSLVDYNRAGAPLLEIVTEPDIESALEARIFLQELQNIVRYVGAGSADMEKGTMRCEPNISVRKPGEIELPKYKVEVKNINSFKFAEAAINYEVNRHTDILKEGGQPRQVTMGWNEKGGFTVEQRSKEEANDYRYFPDPDLPILHFSRDFVENLKNNLPELPNAKRVRFKNAFSLPDADIDNLIAWKDLNEFFENTISELELWVKDEGLLGEEVMNKLTKQCANWCLQDFSALLNAKQMNPFDSKLTPENLAEMVVLIEKGKISKSAGKEVLKVMFEKGGEPDSIVMDLGLVQTSDEGEISVVIDKVLGENPKAVEDYLSGQQRSFGFLVGQSMKALAGKGNPEVVNGILRKKLDDKKTAS